MDQLKIKYLDKKLKSAFFASKVIDFLIVLLVINIVFSLFAIDEVPTKVTSPEYEGSGLEGVPKIESDKFLYQSFFITLWGMVLFNILMVFSPFRKTIGMKLHGLEVENLDNKPPTLIQATGLVLLSPFYVSVALFMLFTWTQGFLVDYYTLVNATIAILFGSYALQYSVYAFKFGSGLKALQSMTGLHVKFRPKKQEKLEKKFDKKGTTSRKILEKWMNAEKKIMEIQGTLFILLTFYLSVLVVLDLPKKLVFEERLYAPYAIDWASKENGYFALQGLNAPADSPDFYQTGRATSYQDFLMAERVRKNAKISYAFDVPPEEEFAKVDKDAEVLRLKFPSGEKDEKSLYCYLRMDAVDPSTPCASPAELKTIIKDNKILWDRFNRLLDYTEYFRPPVNLANKMRGDDLISLGRIKSADIILMQKNGKSEEALKEWLRYKQFYRRIFDTRHTMVEKAIYLIISGTHDRLLEQLLYNDPKLAINHFDEIAKIINPQGVSMFRGQSMMLDDWANVDPFMPSIGLGRSPGIRNKFYECLVKIDQLAELPAKEYFFGNINQKACTRMGGDNPYRTVIEWWFLTTGNPATNSAYGMAYSGLQRGQALIANMHVHHTYMRMQLLGAKILHDKIPADKVADYIQTAPVELQNPITEKPFEWDEKGEYLSFVKLNDPEDIQKFHLKIK